MSGFAAGKTDERGLSALGSDATTHKLVIKVRPSALKVKSAGLSKSAQVSLAMSKEKASNLSKSAQVSLAMSKEKASNLSKSAQVSLAMSKEKASNLSKSAQVSLAMSKEKASNLSKSAQVSLAMSKQKASNLSNDEPQVSLMALASVLLKPQPGPFKRNGRILSTRQIMHGWW